jgi:hypothetical protein
VRCAYGPDCLDCAADLAVCIKHLLFVRQHDGKEPAVPYTRAGITNVLRDQERKALLDATNELKRIEQLPQPEQSKAKKAFYTTLDPQLREIIKRASANERTGPNPSTE